MGFERYPLSGPWCDFQACEGDARKIDLSTYVVLGRTGGREGRAQFHEGFNLFQGYTTETGRVLRSGARSCCHPLVDRRPFTLTYQSMLLRASWTAFALPPIRAMSKDMFEDEFAGIGEQDR